MSLVTQLTNLITRIGTEFKITKTMFSGNSAGSLTSLNTTNKGSLLEAINEVNTLAGNKQANLGYTPENAAQKAVANGYAGLDGAGKVPIAQLPDIVNKNKGFFATLAALVVAYPTATDGDYAIIGVTDTVWLWDSGTTAWVETDKKGAVVSVNGQTGAVVIADAIDAGASGLMTGADKTKLNGIAASANNYVHATADGSIHLPANGTTNLNKVPKASGTAGSWSLGFVAWSELENKPNNIAGYAINDAYTKTEIGDITTDFVAAFNTAIT